MRRHHFKVDGLHGFGAATGRVTIEQGQTNAIVRVRPLRSQIEAVMLLSDVAQIVLERDAKARVREKAKVRR